jgi:hypothetical protein
MPASSIQYSNGEACMWTIKGDFTDGTSAVNITILSFTQLDVHILQGEDLYTAVEVFTNISKTGSYITNFMNSTFIIAAPQSKKTKGAISFLY